MNNNECLRPLKGVEFAISDAKSQAQEELRIKGYCSTGYSAFPLPSPASVLAIKEDDAIEQPFKCTICDYAGRNKACLTNHMSRRHNNRPFVCEICKCGYKTEEDLAKHKKKHNDKDRSGIQ